MADILNLLLDMEKANQLGLESFINHCYAKLALCELGVSFCSVTPLGSTINLAHKMHSCFHHNGD